MRKRLFATTSQVNYTLERSTFSSWATAPSARACQARRSELFSPSMTRGFAAPFASVDDARPSGADCDGDAFRNTPKVGSFARSGYRLPLAVSTKGESSRHPSPRPKRRANPARAWRGLPYLLRHRLRAQGGDNLAGFHGASCSRRRQISGKRSASTVTVVPKGAAMTLSTRMAPFSIRNAVMPCVRR